MDLILRNARLIGAEHETDIGIIGGRIAEVTPNLAAEGETIDLGGRLVSSGLIETHIHLDKSAILDRCKADKGDLEEAIQEVAKAKKNFEFGPHLRRLCGAFTGTNDLQEFQLLSFFFEDDHHVRGGTRSQRHQY